MTLPAKASLPQPQFPWTLQALGGAPSQAFGIYMTKLDALIAAMAAGNLPTLINAANDAAAATLGVQIGQAYRNGSQLMVRVT